MGRDHLSIGEVLELIKNDFPEVTVSKIRFLEGQGLLEPERTPSGYRKFYDRDLERLRWILVQQRDHFLPLKVIKARLDGEDVDPPSPDGDQIELPLGDLAPLTDAPPAAPAIPPAVDLDLTDDALTDDVLTDDVLAGSVAEPDSVVEGEQVSAECVASQPAAAVVGANGATSSIPDDGTGASHGSSTPGEDRDPGAWLDDLAAGRVRSAATPGVDADRQVLHADVVSPDDRADDAEAGEGDESAEPAQPDDEPAGEAAALGDEPVTAPEDNTAVNDDEPQFAPPATSTSTGIAEQSDTETVVAGGDDSDDEAAGSSTTRLSPEESSLMGNAPMSMPSNSSPWLDPDRVDSSLTRAELIEASGLTEAALTDLEGYQLITARKSGPVEVYGDDSLEVAVHAKAFYDQGLEARHLRMYLVSAQREAAFLENLVAPLLHRRNDAGRAEAVDIISELGEAGLGLRDALLRGLLESYLTNG